jgi:hypothetical protein
MLRAGGLDAVSVHEVSGNVQLDDRNQLLYAAHARRAIDHARPTPCSHGHGALRSPAGPLRGVPEPVEEAGQVGRLVVGVEATGTTLTATPGPGDSLLVIDHETGEVPEREEPWSNEATSRLPRKALDVVREREEL